MATKKRSELEESLMTPANIAKVIKLLEPEEGKPITKKDACQILGMAYNTTRLGTIIEDYKKKIEREKERRNALRGKPATPDEVSYIVSEYLEGATIESISNSTYRGNQFIYNVLETYDVPRRSTSHDYFKPELVPDGARRDRFQVGEVVWSVRYASKAIVEKEQEDKRNLGFIYRVWLLSDKQLQYAYTEAFELASLKHLEEKGIKL